MTCIFKAITFYAKTCLPFLGGIHRSTVNSSHKDQWRGALMFSLICAQIVGWVNNGEAGDLGRHGAHNDVIIMILIANIYTCYCFHLVLSFALSLFKFLYITVWDHKPLLYSHCKQIIIYVRLHEFMWCDVSLFVAIKLRQWVADRFQMETYQLAKAFPAVD